MWKAENRLHEMNGNKRGVMGIACCLCLLVSLYACSGDEPVVIPQSVLSEEKMAAQQWLRRIPDDPGGLLRRKFLYQYKQQTSQSENSATQNW